MNGLTIAQVQRHMVDAAPAEAVEQQVARQCLIQPDSGSGVLLLAGGAGQGNALQAVEITHQTTAVEAAFRVLAAIAVGTSDLSQRVEHQCPAQGIERDGRGRLPPGFAERRTAAQRGQHQDQQCGPPLARQHRGAQAVGRVATIEGRSLNAPYQRVRPGARLRQSI